MAGLLVDISPLKEVPAFRRFFFGQLVSVIGSGLTIVALRYQAYKLGGDSTFMVSMLALVTLVPLLVSSVIGGSIADAFDRRAVLIVTQIGLGLCSFGLFVNASRTQPSLPVMFVLAAASSALVGIDWPTRSSIVPNLVGPRLMQQAITLNISVFNVAGIIGPDGGPWAGDTSGAFIYDMKGTTENGTVLGAIFDSRDSNDVRRWPPYGRVPGGMEGAIFNPGLRGQLRASDRDVWWLSWEGQASARDR